MSKLKVRFVVMAAVVALTCGVSVLAVLTAAAAGTRGSAETSRWIDVTSAPSWAAAPPLGVSTLGLQGWRVQSSALAPQSGRTISAPEFPAAGWLEVTPDDAGAPGTEIEALLQNGACPNVFYSDNMRKCFGYESRIGPDTVPRFDVPWWYRTEFSPSLLLGQDAQLEINGIVGDADVWVNGTEVATHATVTGDYTRFAFDITKLVRPGTNALALKVYPNNPLTMYTLDNVDWTQIPPDNNTGIQFPIQLRVSDALAMSNSHVLQADAPDLSNSTLTVEADVTNVTSSTQTGETAAAITTPNGRSYLSYLQVRVPAGATTTVTFPPLLIRHPDVWWPYQMGGQPLYTLATGLWESGRIDGTSSEQFGIRTVTSYLIGPSRLAPQGARQFLINGHSFLVRGGGFDPQLFLHYSAADTANQITLLKGMGLNTIRLEGHLMPADFYDQMDRAGILIDAGYQCCDFWAPRSNRSLTPKDLHLLYLSALRLGEDLRDHPSVLNFAWSDNAPTRSQEKVSLEGFAQAGFQDPIISSAEYNSSPILGVSGEKEGPYDWVPPSYWYDTAHSDYARDSTLTNVGGSWLFDSEESAGNTVPTLDSINRFMSPAEQAALWQDPAYNQYHTNYEPGLRGYSFGTLYSMDQALAARYGQWDSLDQYVEEAQVQNYEVTRAQFEAFIDHSTNSPTPATGVIYWQANKGWPTLLWDLYNSDYDEAGSYFGALKANERVHALFAYDNDTVTLDNMSGAAVRGLSVESKVYDLAGNVLDDQTARGLTLEPQEVLNAVLRPRVPPATAPPTPARVYFIELILRRQGRVVDRNVYWLSTQSDIVNWRASEGNPRAVMTQFADLQALRGLAKAKVKVAAYSQRMGGGQLETRVTITNVSTTKAVAFFLRADVRRGDGEARALPGDDEVLPITWTDNDITLWPGESQTLTATYAAAQLKGASAVVSVFGWNVADATYGT